MWDEAEPATIAALDRARAALLAAGARVDDIAVPEEHLGLAEAQDKIMRFEMARSLAWERVEGASLDLAACWRRCSITA